MRDEMIKIVSVIAFGFFASCGGKGKDVSEKPAPAQASNSAQVEAKGAEKQNEVSLNTGQAVLAVVNGQEITESLFNQRLGRYVKPGIRIPDERLNKVKKTILERIIDDSLVLQIAAKEGVAVNDEEIATEYREHQKRFKSPRQFDQHLQQSGMTAELIQQEIRIRVTLKALLEKRNLIGIGEEQARAFYDKNANLYTDQDQVHAAHILVRMERNADAATEEKGKARIAEIQEVLKTGRDFKEVATEMSEGPSKSRGGDLGFFKRGQMVRSFEEVAFTLEPGLVSEPVRTQFGWHIIKVFSRKKGESKTFDSVKDDLIKSLKRKKVITEKRRLIKEVRASAKIEMKISF
jgi:peptidyl-prolyl cis-trans isomerase C